MNPGISPSGPTMEYATYPPSTGTNIPRPNLPRPENHPATSLVTPRVPPEFPVSSKNPIPKIIPPATMNGSILETPPIKFL